MRSTFRCGLSLAPVLLMFSCASTPVGTKTPAGTPPIGISVNDLGSKYQLLGRLGKPMGQLVTIQGVVQEPGRNKGNLGIVYVLVSRIDGVATQAGDRIRPYPFFLKWGEMGEGGPPVLESGKTFELVGCEYGGYTGTSYEMMQRGGTSFQDYDFHFECSFSVCSGKMIDDVPLTPADFVGREALIPGIARNSNARPTIVGKGWLITLDGAPWDAGALGKSVEAFGRIREDGPGRFTMESVATSRRGLVNLADQVGRQVALRGLGWKSRERFFLNYRGAMVYVDNSDSQASSCSAWGDPVEIRGVLERAVLPDLSQSPHTPAAEQHMKEYYIVRKPRCERVSGLLIPEIGPAPE